MALVPCKVCGTLNSSDVDICLSCEFPITGRRRPVIFQWAGFVLAFIFSIPLLLGVINLFNQRLQPDLPSSPSTPAQAPSNSPAVTA